MKPLLNTNTLYTTAFQPHHSLSSFVYCVFTQTDGQLTGHYVTRVLQTHGECVNQT